MYPDEAVTVLLSIVGSVSDGSGLDIVHGKQNHDLIRSCAVHGLTLAINAISYTSLG